MPFQQPFSFYDDMASQLPSGHWMCPISQQNSVTSAALGNNTLRVMPYRVSNPLSIQAVAAGITVIGDVGSVLRLGSYLDDGTGKPGQLFMEWGTVPGDVVATPIININFTLPGGTIVHIGGAVQLAATTQPTVSCNTQSNFISQALDVSTANPASATSSSGYSMAGVAGALPQTFVPAAGGINAGPRLFFKKA